MLPSSRVEAVEMKVSERRAILNDTLAQAVPALENLVAEAVDQLVEKVVLVQHEVTMAMDVSDRATLKYNLEQAKRAAVSGVRGVVDVAVLEERSKKALLNQTGATFIHPNEELSPLLSGAVGLLTKSGYTLRLVSARAGRPVMLSDLIGGTSLGVIGRNVDGAVEELGKAKIALAAVQQEVQQRAARKLWDEA